MSKGGGEIRPQAKSIWSDMNHGLLFLTQSGLKIDLRDASKMGFRAEAIANSKMSLELHSQSLRQLTFTPGIVIQGD